MISILFKEDTFSCYCNNSILSYHINNSNVPIISKMFNWLKKKIAVWLTPVQFVFQSPRGEFDLSSFENET